MERFFPTPKKTQQSILTFAVKTSPFTFVHRPSPPRKRQLMEKRGPGRPKKKLREEDWRQKWYDVAESKSYSSIGVWEEYEAAIINYHTADENSRAPILPKKNSRNVHSGESSKYVNSHLLTGCIHISR